MVHLSNQSSADRLPTFLSVSIDKLNKADAQLIAEAYLYLLGVQCLLSLSDSLAGHSFPLYITLTVQNPPVGSTEPVFATGPTRNRGPARAGLRLGHH